MENLEKLESLVEELELNYYQSIKIKRLLIRIKDQEIIRNNVKNLDLLFSGLKMKFSVAVQLKTILFEILKENNIPDLFLRQERRMLLDNKIEYGKF